MNIKQLLYVITGLLISYTPVISHAEMIGLEESELSKVSGQSGLSIEIPHIRINAHQSGSVDNPNTPADESDGRRTKGFKRDYVTRDHDGANEAHYFVEEVSLAADIKGAITLDVEDSGTLVIGMPDSINFVGDGYSAKGIYLNNTGQVSGGGNMYNEISVQGNFSTGGTISVWGE